MRDPATRKALSWGWLLLAAFLPLGLTLEALHALKVPVYLPDKGKPEEREVFMASETGNIVSTYHDPDSLLDNPLDYPEPVVPGEPLNGLSAHG